MKFTFASNLAATFTLLTVIAVPAPAQQERGDSITEPVYRVAHETPAQQVSAHAVSAPGADGSDFFDLEQRPGEHPLAACKRLAERVKRHIDQEIHDYSCLFSKWERVDGQLQDVNHISMQVMHDPFSVHMVFRKPKAGQECLYVQGANDNKLKARGHGWRGTIAGVLSLDPNGSYAMDGNRHPITKAGIQNLTNELITIAEQDMKYGECDVRSYTDRKVDNRPTVMMEIVHPKPRREFKFHVARIYVDREMKIPVRYEAYDWQKDAKGQPQLEELYMYTDVKLNNGFTAKYFTESNPEVFK